MSGGSNSNRGTTPVWDGIYCEKYLTCVFQRGLFSPGILTPIPHIFAPYDIESADLEVAAMALRVAH